MRNASRSVLCTLLAAGLVSGCDGPFSLTLNKVNEKGPQRNAVIALSDPQPYTRERLLNDRDAEVEFLKDQLSQVNDQDYTPRLKRDLDTLIEIVGALSVKFDPVAAASIVDQAKVTSLQNQVQIEELKNLLDQVDAKQLAAKDPGAANAAAQPGPSTDPMKPIDTTALSTDMHKFLDTLHSLVISRANDPNTQRPGLRDNKVSSATPSEVFRDKLAYRDEIVAALQQAQLDDRHDLNGNALYRLQIKAEINPGKIKDKYAIARYTILPPLFSDSSGVSSLYLDWLAYVAQQLNPVQDGVDDVPSGSEEIAARYSMLGPATGTYRVSYLPYKPKTDLTDEAKRAKAERTCSAAGFAEDIRKDGEPETVNKVVRDCLTIAVPTPPEFEQNDVLEFASLKGVEQTKGLLKLAATKLANHKFELTNDEIRQRRCSMVTIDAKPISLSLDPDDQLAGVNDRLGSLSPEDLAATLVMARNIYNLAPRYLLAIERTRRNYARSGAVSSDALAALQGYAQSLDIAKQASQEMLTAFHVALNPKVGDSEKPCHSFGEVAGRIWVPETFYGAVADRTQAHSDDDAAAQSMEKKDNPAATEKEKKPTTIFVAGSAYAYSTAPTELAQRVSTVASATEAMDLMASVAALIPTAGVGINAAGEMRRVASGHVDAIESAPLVVGFSNNGAQNVETNQSLARKTEPSFGWVFGPKVIVNTEDSELELSQVLKSYPVTADVSVPGWWTEMRLRVETAWVANFDKAMLQPEEKPGLPLSDDTVSSYVISVPLQSNPENFEQLTEFLASKTWGLQQKQPLITDVEPKAVPMCSTSTVLISGTDLWRGRAVYINGVAAEHTEVMPDMRGLAATFSLPNMPAGPANLIIWTQLGKAESTIDIADSPNCGAGAGGAGMTAKAVGGNVIYPGATFKVVLPSSVEQIPYRAVIRRMDGVGDALRITSASVVQTTENELTITIPNEADTKKGLASFPIDGTPMIVELRQEKEDDPRLIATARRVIFYQGAVQDRLTVSAKKAVAKQIAGTSTYNVTIPLPPKFAIVYPGSITAEVTGFEDEAKKATTISDRRVGIAGDVAKFSFDAGKLKVTGDAKTLTVKLNNGDQTLTVTPTIK